MSIPCNVDSWTKCECIEFLRTVKGAKLSGNKVELISRVKGYIEHPEILDNIRQAPESTITTVLDIHTVNESSLHWSNDQEKLPWGTGDVVECYVKTRRQAALAMQEKGY